MIDPHQQFETVVRQWRDEKAQGRKPPRTLKAWGAEFGLTPEEVKRIVSSVYFDAAKAEQFHYGRAKMAKNRPPFVLKPYVRRVRKYELSPKKINPDGTCECGKKGRHVGRCRGYMRTKPRPAQAA